MAIELFYDFKFASCLFDFRFVRHNEWGVVINADIHK